MNITFEQLLAGALLKFNGEVDTLTMSLLIENLIQTENFLNKPIKLFSNIAEFISNKYKLRNGLTLDSYLEKEKISVKDYLTNLAGSNILVFLDKIDLKEFVLKKIDYLTSILTDELHTKLNKVELALIPELIDNGYLELTWLQNLAPYDDYQVLKLSKKGYVYLFMKTYFYQINVFKNELEKIGLNSNLLMLYLSTINLNRPFNEIFNLESFRLFGQIYDLDITNHELSR